MFGVVPRQPLAPNGTAPSEETSQERELTSHSLQQIPLVHLEGRSSGLNLRVIFLEHARAYILLLYIVQERTVPERWPIEGEVNLNHFASIYSRCKRLSASMSLDKGYL
jgi:hypothetical protein